MQDLSRLREFLPLEKRRRGLLVRLPERLVRGFARVAERRIRRGARKPAFGPRDRRADHRHPVAGVVTVRSRQPRLGGFERVSGEMPAVGRALRLEGRVDRRLERRVRAVVVAEGLLRQPDDGPERRGLAGRTPGRVSPKSGERLLADRQDLVEALFLIKGEAAFHERRISRNLRVDRRRSARRGWRRPRGRLGQSRRREVGRRALGARAARRPRAQHPVRARVR